MGSFLCFYLKGLFANYFEYIGWEIITFLLGAYHDPRIIAAWGIFQSATSLGGTWGMGFAQAGYMYIGTLISMERHKHAKKICMWIIYTCSLSYLPMTFVYIFARHPFAEALTSDPNTAEYVAMYFLVYGCCSSWVDPSYACFVTNIKQVNKIMLSS